MMAGIVVAPLCVLHDDCLGCLWGDRVEAFLDLLAGVGVVITEQIDGGVF